MKSDTEVHRLLKQYKIGIKNKNNLTMEERALLERYYPWLFEDGDD